MWVVPEAIALKPARLKTEEVDTSPKPADAATASATAGGRSRLATAIHFSVSGLFSLFTASQCRLLIHYQAEPTLQPRSIVVFNHKRDLDIPVLVTGLFDFKTLVRWGGRLAFLGRSDLYLNGFLALRFPQLGLLRRQLYHFNLGPILHAANILPVGKAGARLVAEWIEQLTAIYGPDRLLADVLSPAGLERAALAGIASTCTLADVTDWRHEGFLRQEAGAEFIAMSRARQLRVLQAPSARRQLAAIASDLRAGNVAILAPEGELSPDGRLQPFRSGLHRLVQQVPGVSVVPVGITYDLLCSGRPTAFMQVGRPLLLPQTAPRRECEDVIRDHLARLNTITLPQLASTVVFDRLGVGVVELSREALAEELFAQARILEASGFMVDPRMTDAKQFRRRYAEFLRCARGHGLDTYGDIIRVDRERVQAPLKARFTNPLGYAYNEMQATRAAAALDS